MMRAMTHTSLKIVASFIISILLLACEDSSNKAQPQITISDTPTVITNTESSFQNLQGKPIELSDYAGQTLVLNYWATWCAPCIREIPSLIQAASILKEEGFIFLLASDESLEDINEFVADHDFQANFIKLNTFFASHGVEAVPSTVLFNSSGEIVNTWLGEREWDSPETLAMLRDSEE